MNDTIKSSISNALRAIEDKCLERGTFSGFLDDCFELTIAAQFNPDADDNFEIHIKLSSQSESTLGEDAGEEISDMIEDDFFEIIENTLSEEDASHVRDSFAGKSLFLNEELIY